MQHFITFLLPPQHTEEEPITTHLRPEDLALRWETSTKTLANWRCAGIGPTYLKINSLVRYRLADVVAYEEAQAVRAVA